MNIQEYIASGILESYVLDELSISEKQEVEKLLHEHTELRDELLLIEESMERLAFSTSIAPPTHIKDSLLKEIEPTISISDARNGNFLRYAAAASVIIAMGSLIMAFTFWSKWKAAENQLADMVAQNQQVAENYNTVNQRLGDIEAAVAIMNDRAFERVIMNGTDNAPQSSAAVYWNSNTQQVYLSIHTLQELAENQQFQLWAIIDGKPVDAGVFSQGNQFMLAKMKNISGTPAAFAVTIEPSGGSQNPTLETMQVLGNVSS